MIINMYGRIVFAIIQFFVHLMVIYYYEQGILSRLFPDRWSEQFEIAVWLLLGLSLVMLFIHYKNVQKGLFFVRMFFLMAISLPFTGNPGHFGLLYALQALECFLYFTNEIALGICGFYILFIFWLANQQVVLWDFYMPKQSAKMFAFFILSLHCLFGGAIGQFMAREQRLRSSEKQLFNELQISNRCLAEANIGLQNVAVQAELVSVFKERTRFAREIHDSIAYTFTNLIALLNSYLVQERIRGRSNSSEIEKARDLAVDGLSELRQALHALRPGEQGSYNGLGSILRIVRIFKQATGVEVKLNYGDVPQFIGEPLENVIYRAVQEGLTNSFRHGKATEIFVSFYQRDGGIEVTIKDNGRGTTSSSSGGYGLIGINERVSELGGMVSIVSKPGNGFALRIWLPFPKEG